MRTSHCITLSIGFLLFAIGCRAPEESTPAGAGGPNEPAQATSESEGPTSSEDEVVHIRGEITRVSPAEPGRSEDDTLGRILVEGTREDDTMYDRASVRVTSGTRILAVHAGDLRVVTFGDLETGQIVEVRFEGGVAESYPVKATAATIVILER